MENKRKIPLALKILLVILVVLVLLAGAAYAYVQVQLNKINRVEPDASSSYVEEDFEPDTEEADTIADSSLDWGSELELEDTAVEGVINVLLVGQDTRVPGERARSDSMILLSINKNTNQITMVSMMRDLYVQIPGYSNNKMNAAYAFGGFELLDATVLANFGVQVDYNIEVDFSGFSNIIDALGGVDITLNADEAEYLQGQGYSVTEGDNHLDGAEALAYSRIRYVGFFDFQRTYRQRTVLQSIYNELRSKSWTTLLGVYNQIADQVTTDMTNNEILNVAFTAYSMGLDEINSYRLPTDGGYSNQIINGMDVLVMNDWDEARSLMNDFLYSEDAGASKVDEEKVWN